MTLTSPRFAGNARLQSAAENSPPLRKGEQGLAVQILQQALIDLGYAMPITNKTGTPDGIYGDETVKTVGKFQTQYKLSADGIAGRNTLAQLDKLFSPRPEREFCCGTCMGDRPHFSFANLPNFGASAPTGTGSLTAPTTIRPPNTTEKNKIKNVYVDSIDFDTVLITDGLGMSGRAFVVATTLPGPIPSVVQIVNIGPSPSDSLLIHEFGHVWQSQHHIDPTQFMKNAVASQALATLLGNSAYYYIPGKPFGSYGAEQIAQMIQNNETDIVNHVKSVAKNKVDAFNTISLSVPRTQDPKEAGAKK